MIVVLDASTFISAALTIDGVPERALSRIVAPPGLLVLSRVVEAEYREVIFRPKFDCFASVQCRGDVLNIVLAAAKPVEPDERVQDCRDPKDDKHLKLAWAARADVVVSSDVRHLLSMHPWRSIPILSPADYLAWRPGERGNTTASAGPASAPRARGSRGRLP